jgi:hypothetical protein
MIKIAVVYLSEKKVQIELRLCVDEAEDGGASREPSRSRHHNKQTYHQPPQ